MTAHRFALLPLAWWFVACGSEPDLELAVYYPDACESNSSTLVAAGASLQDARDKMSGGDMTVSRCEDRQSGPDGFRKSLAHGDLHVLILAALNAADGTATDPRQCLNGAAPNCVAIEEVFPGQSQGGPYTSEIFVMRSCANFPCPDGMRCIGSGAPRCVPNITTCKRSEIDRCALPGGEQ